MLKFSLKKEHLNVNERFPCMTESDMIHDEDGNAADDLLAELVNACSGMGENDVQDRAITGTVPAEADGMPPLEPVQGL